MNNLIWITEKELNYENKFISKIKEGKKLLAYWYCDNWIKPITFEGENIVINWSYEFNKVEFYMTKEYFKGFIINYFYLMYYGEWGNIQEKPIIFMEIYGKNFYKKSIKPFKVKDLYKFLKQNDEVKIVIYFETTIQKDPEKESYNRDDNIWMSNLGGLYHIVDIAWELNNKSSIKYEKKKFFSYDIEEYVDWNESINIYKETAITAKEMKKNKMKWEKFKFCYSD